MAFFGANLTFGPGKPSPRGPFSPWTPCGPWGPWLDEAQMSYNQFYGCKFNVLISKQLWKLNMYQCLLLYLQADLARLCHVDPEDPISPEIPYLPTKMNISENPQPLHPCHLKQLHNENHHLFTFYSNWAKLCNLVQMLIFIRPNVKHNSYGLRCKWDLYNRVLT